ncbi:MAG: hypothetical protein ACJA0K_001085 [Maricaulis maris]|jgi:hypothetical protein
MTEQKPNRRRPSKKTGMLEVRVSPEEKAAFLEVCRAAGRSASSVIRDAMRAYANFGPMARLPGSPIMISSAFVGAALGAWVFVAVTGVFNASPEERVWGFAEFRRIDVNRDQLIDRAEYRSRYPDARAVFVSGRPDATPARRAALLSMFEFFDLDPRVFVDHANQVSDVCWADLAERDQMMRDAEFLAFDRDLDSHITPTEFSDALLARWTNTFGQMDRNGDGILDRADRLESRVINGEHGTRFESVSTTTSPGMRPVDGFGVRPQCPAEVALAASLPRLSDVELRQLTSYTELSYQCSDCDWWTMGRGDDLDGSGTTSLIEFMTAQDR